MSLMLGFLFFLTVVVWTAVATYNAVSDRNLRGKTAFIGVLIVVISSFLAYMRFYDAIGSGIAASLETNTTYTVSNVYTTGAGSEVVLELRTDKTGKIYRYFYNVSCNSLRDGCPDKWPSTFKMVKDSEKLVIVPLSPTKSN